VSGSMIRAGLVALVMLVCLPASGFGAQTFYDGNQLFELCKRSPATCLGYVMGVGDAMQEMGGILAEWRVCPPMVVTSGQPEMWW
jgi:hypothetical protein